MILHPPQTLLSRFKTCLGRESGCSSPEAGASRTASRSGITVTDPRNCLVSAALAAEHLDERHIATNGRLLSNPHIMSKLRVSLPPQHPAFRCGLQEEIPDRQPNPIRASTAKPKTRDLTLWQPRALHLGRTHVKSDTTLRWLEGNTDASIEDVGLGLGLG